jgi:hypothetical protein
LYVYVDDVEQHYQRAKCTGASVARPKHPKFQCQTLPEVDWSALWLGGCNRFHEKASLVNSQFMLCLCRRGDASFGPWIVPPRFHPHSL